MQLISTDYRDYLPDDELPTRNSRVPDLRPLADSASRVIAYAMISMGLTLLAWGAGLGGAAIVGVLFGYPVAESLGWAGRRAHGQRINR